MRSAAVHLGIIGRFQLGNQGRLTIDVMCGRIKSQEENTAWIPEHEVGSTICFWCSTDLGYDGNCTGAWRRGEFNVNAVEDAFLE